MQFLEIRLSRRIKFLLLVLIVIVANITLIKNRKKIVANITNITSKIDIWCYVNKNLIIIEDVVDQVALPCQP